MPENQQSTGVYICVWCTEEYGTSHAHQPKLFCSRRCEIEARYWLLTVLNSCSPETES